MAEQVTFTEARRLIERHVKMLGTELTGLSARALGRRLAARVEAVYDSPPFDCSAMDGYAIRYRAGPSSRPEVLQTFVLGGEVSAAGPRVGIDPGQAVAVSTGSPIPVGAYGVIPNEKAKSDGRTLTIHGSGSPGQNIRRAGEDFRAGQPIATAGDQLSPELIAALTATGVQDVPTRRRPTIELVTTGSEFVSRTRGAGPRRYDSNTPLIAALASEIGLECRTGEPVEDNGDVLRSAFESAAGRSADILLSTGGASAGTHDHVRDELEALGAEIIFHGISMRPGKPLLFAMLPDGRPFFGLPGNPVAALVGFRFFVLSAARRMEGLTPEFGRNVSPTGLARDGLTVVQAATLDPFTSDPVIIPDQRSHLLRPLLKADGWVRIEKVGECEDARYYPRIPSRRSDR